MSAYCGVNQLIVRNLERRSPRTCQLGRSSTHDRNEARGVDNAPTSSQALSLVGLVLPHGEDGVFASPPNTLDVDLHGQIPDLFFRVQGVVVRRMHDPSVVELSNMT